MYRRRAPTMVYALIFAIVGAIGDWIAGGVLVALVFAWSAANYFDQDDSSGLYGD